MPQPVSLRQWRYLMALKSGKPGSSARGDRMSESAQKKFSDTKPSGPESKGKEYEGGMTPAGSGRHPKGKKKKKDKLNKAYEEFVKAQDRRGAGCLVINNQGQILLGRRNDNGKWATPGGTVEAGESFYDGAVRELYEEAGIKAAAAEHFHSHSSRGVAGQTFLVKKFKGKIKSNGELLNLKFMNMSEIPWDKLTDYAKDSIDQYIQDKLKKSNKLADMLVMEDLEKNIIRSGSAPHDVVYEVTHGDAMKLVGNGTFRMLRDAVRGMGDEDFRDVKIDNYILHIRKHTTDIYSGRIDDGHKQIHQFTNKSLPAVTAELMSLFEWYLPEDEGELEVIDEDVLTDDAIEGGIGNLVDNYKRHNIANIYEEMENIRESMRHGMAVDLQQVEHRIMKLFDKLEATMMGVIKQHNHLTQEAGDAVMLLESKLRDLQNKVDELSQQPKTVHAYSSAPQQPSAVHSAGYPYLSKPQVEISPDGKIRIHFSGDWTPMEQSDFLNDMKAKVVKKKAE